MPTVEFKEEISLTTETCCACGVVFAWPTAVRKRFIEKGGNFYCPNGHSQHFMEPEIPRLNRELEEANKRVTQARCETLAEKAKREAAERVQARHLRRAKNGVCPCCQRSFQNLRRHIATKHPGFSAK